MTATWPVLGTPQAPSHPQGWRWVRLTDVAHLATGHTPARDRPEYWDGGVPWINLNEIRQLDGEVCERTELQISPAGVANSSAVVHPAGTVCMSRTASVGFVTQMGRPMATSQDFVNWICGPQLHPDYLVAALRASRPHLLSLCSGSTHKTLYLRDAERLRVLLPPVEEQRRIAAILQAANALRSKRKKAIGLLDAIIGASFVDHFVRHGTSSSKKLGELAAPVENSIRTGPFGSQLLHEEFTESGVAVLGIDNAVQNRFVWARRRFISEAKYAQLRRYTVHPGDVLVTIMGTCGRVAVVPDDVPTAISTKHLCCITLNLDECLPEYLWGCLRFHPDVLRQLGATHGAVMPGLNMGLIRRAEIPLPPIPAQRWFAEVIRTVDAGVLAARRSEARLEDLVASLQYRAFAGEL